MDFNVIFYTFWGSPFSPMWYWIENISILLVKISILHLFILHYVPPQYPESIGEYMWLDAIKTV